MAEPTSDYELPIGFQRNIVDEDPITSLTLSADPRNSTVGTPKQVDTTAAMSAIIKAELDENAGAPVNMTRDFDSIKSNLSVGNDTDVTENNRKALSEALIAEQIRFTSRDPARRAQLDEAYLQYAAAANSPPLKEWMNKHNAKTMETYYAMTAALRMPDESYGGPVQAALAKQRIATEAYEFLMSQELPQGMFTLARDFLVSIVLPTSSGQLQDFKFGKESSSFLNPAQIGESLAFYETLQKGIAALPIETRALLFPVLLRELRAVTGGATDVHSEGEMLLRGLFDPAFYGYARNVAVPFDALSVSLTAAGAISKIGKAGQLAAVAKARGARRMSAKIMVESMHNPDIAKAMGTTQASARAGLWAFNNQLVDPTLVHGVAPEMVREIESTVALNRQVVGQAVSDVVDLRASALTREEQAAAQTRALDSLPDVIEMPGPAETATKLVVRDAAVINTSQEGFTIKVIADDGTEAATPVVWKQDISYTYNDKTGFANPTEPVIFSSWFLSPSKWLERIKPGAVIQATKANFQEAKLVASFNLALKEAVRGLSAEARNVVDAALVAGDEAGKVWTASELRAGNAVWGGHQMTDAQIKSYYALRDMFDYTWSVKNKEIRDMLTFQGYKRINMDGGLELLGKVPDRRPTRGVSAVVGMKDGKPVVRRFGVNKLKEAEAAGNVLMRLRVPKNGVSWAVVPKGKVGKLPATVLNKRPGYVPLVRTDITHIVKGVVRDEDGSELNHIVFRVFGREDEAKAWAAEQNAARRTGATHQYEVQKSSDYEVSNANDVEIQTMGGLYVDDRATTPIKYGLAGIEPPRKSGLESLEQNFRHISTRLPMAHFRLGLTEDFRRTFGKYLERSGDWNSAVQRNVDEATKAKIESAREWIKAQIRMPTTDERQWSRFMDEVGLWMEKGPNSGVTGKAWEASRRWLLANKNASPAAKIRSMTYHATLGLFHANQLLIQGFGASLAFSMNPAKFPTMFRRYLATRMAITARLDPDVMPALARAAGMDERSFMEMASTFDKSGMYNSVYTNADYNALSLGFDVDKGLMKKTLDAGSVFVNEGELFSRGYSFMLAWDNWRTKNPVALVDDVGMDAILGETMRMSLNLTRANRAAWQQGLLSIPTQFWQITSKFLESLLGKEWTKTEKAKILTGQLFLFGAAGVPIGELAYNAAVNFSGLSGDQLSPEAKAWAHGGAIELMSEVAVGHRLDMGSRLSVGGGVDQLVRQFIANEITLDKAAMGAFQGPASRASKAFSALGPLITNPLSYEWNAEILTTHVNNFGRIASSWNDFHKAYKMQQHQAYITGKGLQPNQAYITGPGKRLFQDQYPDWNSGVIYAQAIGFSPYEVGQYEDITEYNRKMQEMYKEIGSSYRNVLLRYYANDIADPAIQANFEAETRFIFDGIDSEKALKIKNEVLKEMIRPGTELGKAHKIAVQRLDETETPIVGGYGSALNLPEDEYPEE